MLPLALLFVEQHQGCNTKAVCGHSHNTKFVEGYCLKVCKSVIHLPTSTSIASGAHSPGVKPSNINLSSGAAPVHKRGMFFNYVAVTSPQSV